jgi:hypothetical protein
MGAFTELDTLQERRLNYSDICDDFCDGDVLMFRGGSAISKIFRTGAGSAYSHTGLVAWWHRRVMLFHATAESVQVMPASLVIHQYDGVIDWYQIRPELRSRLDPIALVSEAQNNLGLSYGTKDMVRTVLHDLVGMRMPEDGGPPGALFCSQYVARCFRVGGLPLSDERDSEIFPSEVAASEVLRYAGTIVPDLRGERLRATSDRG